jgi:predicted nucleic acid-binding protein
MMRFLLDTNILVLMIKSKAFYLYFEENFLRNTENHFCLCFVSLGELDSIAVQNQWGAPKLKAMGELLKKLEIIPLNNKTYSQSYAIIDAFSQGKLRENPLPAGISSRNMGKNDLWIASVAYSLKATLVTTDKDFFHLQDVWFPIVYIDIQQFETL